jgi:hypothetical protein
LLGYHNFPTYLNITGVGKKGFKIRGKKNELKTRGIRN